MRLLTILTDSDVGKLAPTLIEDLHLYDPRRPLANGLNVLRDTPLFYSGYNNVAALLPEDSCRHAWCSKDKQCDLPALDAQPSPDSIYKLAGVCRNCRMHIELEVDYTTRWESDPCPNSSHPLHHFVHSPWRVRNENFLGNVEPNFETYAFECSSVSCSATVFVRHRPPVLSDEYVRLLTDRALLNQRAEEVIESEPARFEGHKKPTPVDVLSDLRSYLKNSVDQQETRPIKADNKRFSLRFGLDGQACKDMLSFLGFKHEVGFTFRVYQEAWG
jgi:ubiquitin carboxyl-terminal hydrolase 25